MSDDKASIFEKFKIISIFLSTVVISAVGIYLTNIHNKNEIEKTTKIAEAQIEVARISNMTKVIQILSSENKVERRMAAISVGLYGEVAIPALISLLEDPDGEVRFAATESLCVIGEPAFESLKERFENKINSIDSRAGSIYAIGKMRHPEAKQLVLKALNDKKEDIIVKKDAIAVLGYVKDESSIKLLEEILTQSNHEDILLNTVWALGQIDTKESRNILEAYLIRAPENLYEYTQNTLNSMYAE